LDGRHADQVDLSKLRRHLNQNPIEEIILAFDATLEGDTTALYLREHLTTHPFIFSRLASGIPAGGSLEYLSPSTLLFAFEGRQKL
jgi:recombination protein RecR